MHLENEAEIVSVTSYLSDISYRDATDLHMTEMLMQQGIFKIPEWTGLYQDCAFICTSFSQELFDRFANDIGDVALINPWIHKTRGHPRVLHHRPGVPQLVPLGAILDLHRGRDLRPMTSGKRAFLDDVFPRYSGDSQPYLLRALRGVPILRQGQSGDVEQSCKQLKQYIDEKLLSKSYK
jgi:hypothetical protein